MAQLPLFYKNGKAVGPGGSVKRWKDVYLLVIILVAFMVILSGIVWFVPIPEEGVTYEETAARFEGLGVSSASQTEAPIEDPNQSQPQPEQFNPHLDPPADVKVDVPKASVEESGGAARVDHTTAVPAGSSHESNVVTEETAASDEQNKHGKEDTARRRKVVEVSLCVCVCVCVCGGGGVGGEWVCINVQTCGSGIECICSYVHVMCVLVCGGGGGGRGKFCGVFVCALSNGLSSLLPPPWYRSDDQACLGRVREVCLGRE